MATRFHELVATQIYNQSSSQHISPLRPVAVGPDGVLSSIIRIVSPLVVIVHVWEDDDASGLPLSVACIGPSTNDIVGIYTRGDKSNNNV